jgi:hypothetical protein
MPACVHARADSILHRNHAQGQLWHARAQNFTPSGRGFQGLGVTDFTRSGTLPATGAQWALARLRELGGQPTEETIWLASHQGPRSAPDQGVNGTFSRIDVTRRSGKRPLGGVTTLSALAPARVPVPSSWSCLSPRAGVRGDAGGFVLPVRAAW